VDDSFIKPDSGQFPDKSEFFLHDGDSPKPDSEKQSGSVKTNIPVDKSPNNSGTKPAHNSPELTRFAKEVKHIVQELISINEPDHFQYHNFTLSTIKQARHRTISYSQQPKPRKRSPDEHNRNKHIKPSARPEPGNEPEVPKDVLERSFKNPNFFSSHLLKRQSKSIEVESSAHTAKRDQERINSTSKLQTDTEHKIIPDDRPGEAARLTFADLSEVPRQHEGLIAHTNPNPEEAGQNHPAKRDNSIDKAVKNSNQHPHQKSMRPAEAFLHKQSREISKRKIEPES